MKRTLKKILVLAIIAVVPALFFGFSGCSYYPKKIEGDVWTYYIRKDGQIQLIGLNPVAIPEDKVLYIPGTVDGRKVVGFGMILGKTLIGSYGDAFQIPYMQKITVAEGVPITYDFWWNGRIIELESKDPKDVIAFASKSMRLIVPDGCRNAYIAALEAQRTGESKQYIILEKSESIGLEWFVDENGLLRGYFGLNGDHYVLPDGIKRIDGGSFGGGAVDSPKTIILNEDLEEIGDHGLNFNYRALDEIRIPKSVKSIGKYGVIAKKIYMYRTTTIDLYGFIDTSNIIYLD